MKDPLVCDRCGSAEVEQIVWYDPNRKVVTEEAQFEDDPYWCRKCEKHPKKLVRKSVYGAQKPEKT